MEKYDTGTDQNKETIATVKTIERKKNFKMTYWCTNNSTVSMDKSIIFPTIFGSSKDVINERIF